MDYESYLNDTENIFHQLRGHYLRLNMEEHFDFDVFRRPEKEERVLADVVEKLPMQINILKSRLQKMNYIKMRRKGMRLENEEAEQKNLQNSNNVSYFTVEQLMEKLSANDKIEKDDDTKYKTWRQLSEDEQREKLKEFSEKFKDDMDPEIWKELRKDLYKNLKEGNFDNSTVINWHKGSQKILEINGLVINPVCFYWN